MAGIRLAPSAGYITADLADIRAEATAARAEAAAADAKAANARQMVLNRDATLNQAATEAAQAAAKYASLADLAAAYEAALQASVADRAQLRAMIEALQAKAIQPQVVRVSTNVVLSLLGGAVDMTATWPKPWPDANYLSIPLFDQGTGVVNTQPLVIKAQTTTTVTVSVKSNVTIAGGLAVNVVGLRFG